MFGYMYEQMQPVWAMRLTHEPDTHPCIHRAWLLASEARFGLLPRARIPPYIAWTGQGWNSRNKDPNRLLLEHIQLSTCMNGGRWVTKYTHEGLHPLTGIGFHGAIDFIVNITDDKCLFLNGLTIIFNRSSVQRNNSFLFLPLLEWVWLQRENQELASRSLEHCIHFIEDICACSVILVDYYILDGGQDDYYGCEFLLHFPLLSI
jgi:hypothetical protein